MADIFVSYSRRDKAFVQKLVQSLNENGRNVWVDWEDIPGGADWLQEIYAGIRGSDTVLFVISPDSVQSEVCGWELKHAVENKKRLVPLLYREVVSEADKKMMHPAVSSHNWLFFRDSDDYDKNFSYLLEVIDTDLDHVRDHTRLLVRAKQWDAKNRSTGFVLSGGELVEAEQWLSQAVNKDPEPTELHSQYIYFSRQVANRRQRTLMVGALIAAAVSLVLAVLAVINFFRAEEQRKIAEEQRAVAERNAEVSQRLTLAANAQLDLALNNNDHAIALALEANNISSPPVEAQRILEDAAYAPGTRQVFTGHDGAVNSVTFSPDGVRAVSAGDDSMLIVWNVATGEILNRLEGHEGPVRTAVFTSGGTRVLSGGDDGNIFLWDLETGEVLRRYEAHEGPVRSVTFSPDGSRIASAGEDSLVIVWDTESGQELRRLEGHVNFVYAVDFSPDGSVLASGSEDRYLILWDVESGEELRRVDTGYQVTGLDFNLNGQTLVASSGGFQVNIFNVETLELEQQFIGHLAWVNRAVFGPAGLFVLSGADDNTMRLWNTLTGSQVFSFGGHSQRVNDIAFSPDGRRALTASADGTLRLWDLAHGAELARLDGHQSDVVAAGFNIYGDVGFSGSWDTSIILWNLQTRREIRRFEGHDTVVITAAINEEGTQLLAGDFAGMVLWDVESGEQLHRFSDIGWSFAVDFSPDGTRAVSGSYDGDLILWDLETYEEVLRFAGHSSLVWSAEFSPDGATILTASGDGSVVVWNVGTGEEIRRLTFAGESPSGASFSPDGSLIAVRVGSRVLLYDALTGSEQRTLEGHTAPINSLVFSSDGLFILTGSDDTTIRVWDTGSGAELRRINTGSAVRSVALSPEGRLAMTGGNDFSVRLWAITPPTLDEVRAWTAANRYVPQFSCREREQYHLEVAPECAQAEQSDADTASG